MAKLAEVNKAIELSSHKINLGAAEDLAKAQADLNNLLTALAAEKTKFKTADDAISKAKADAEKMIQVARTNADKVSIAGEKTTSAAAKTLSRVDGILTKVEKQAKDLGLDAKSIPNYSDTEKLYIQVDNEISAVKGYVWVNE